MLCAGYVGARTVVTPVSSNTAVDRWGRFERVIRTRIGSPYVIAAMDGALAAGLGPVVGYEANGGFLLGSDVTSPRGTRLAALPTRDSVLPMLSLLAMAAERGVPLSRISEGLPARYTASDRLQQFPVERSRAILARLRSGPEALRAFFAGAGEVSGVDETDGVRVTLRGGDIVHLRPSGNAPELRCYAEADTPGRAKELCAWGLRVAGEA
jgi:phosphomannomutase